MKTLIVGKGASGKDTFCNTLIARGSKKCVFHTSRPKRENEVDGVDYHFWKELPENALANAMVGSTYNDWVYALTQQSWDNGDVAVFTPAYLKQLPKEIREKCVVIYLDVPETVRRHRLSKRHDADFVDRRLKGDAEDFDGFRDYDIILSNWGIGELEDIDFGAEIGFKAMLDVIESKTTVEEAAKVLDGLWGKSNRLPLPEETLESYAVSRFHLHLNSFITIQESGQYMFLYMDKASKSLKTVGNCQIDTAADSLFEGLTRTIFRKVKEAQMESAEAYIIVQAVFDSPAFGSLSKRTQENIRGYLNKGVPAVLAGLTSTKTTTTKKK